MAFIKRTLEENEKVQIQGLEHVNLLHGAEFFFRNY
jgi:hypothetical protein